MSYYVGNTNKEYKNYYANPSSAYTLTTPQYNAAVKKEQNKQQNAQIVKAAEEKRANIAANVDPRITQRQNQTTTPSNNNSNNEPVAPTSGTGSTSYDPIAGYYDRIVSLYEKQLAEEQARQEALRQQRIEAANKIKDQRIEATNATYNTSMANLDNAKEDSLRQAYIKYMQEQKALPQQMQALGLTGGATETTLASLKNAYGSNRTGIMNNALSEQRQIEADRANAIAGAEADAAAAELDAYSAASEYEANALREYNNSLIDVYASALKPTTTSTSTSTSQITKNPWYNVAVGYLGDGMSTDEVITTLRQQGVSDDIIDAILYSWESTI